MTEIEAGHAIAALLSSLRGCESRLNNDAPNGLGDAFPGLDRDLRDSFFAADALRRLIVLHRTPAYAPYDPLEALRRYSGELASHAQCDSAKPLEILGDQAQSMECVKLLRENIEMDPGARLMLAVFLRAKRPRIAIGVEGTGSLREPLNLGPNIRITMPDLEERWAAATGGGVIERDGDTLSLYFGGRTPLPPLRGKFDRSLDPVVRAARKLQSWRGASGMYEPGLASPEEAATLYARTIAGAIEALEEARHRLS